MHISKEYRRRRIHLTGMMSSLLDMQLLKNWWDTGVNIFGRV